MGRTVVGLDIGSSGVRAVEIRTGGRAPSLRKFATAPLPTGALRGGVVADTAAVAGVLRKLWSAGRFSTKEVSFGIASEGVLVRQMDLDWMPPADFAKALRYQVADALPVPVDEANLDYHVLGEHEVPGEKDGQTRRVVRILLVAAARDVVDGFVDAVQAAGLRPVRADLLPFALIRSTSTELAADGPAEAIVDIGADTVAVTVHTGGRPRFVRMIPGLGGNHLTRALQDRHGWSWEEAERTKIAVGLPVADPTRLAGAPADDHPAQQVITKQVTALLAEVRTTLDFFRTSSAEPQELSRLLLTGRGSRLSGLADLLSHEIGIPVEPLAPLAGVRTRRRRRPDDETLTTLAAPAGLCLGVTSR